MLTGVLQVGDKNEPHVHDEVRDKVGLDEPDGAIGPAGVAAEMPSHV